MGASNSETTYRIHHWRMQGCKPATWGHWSLLQTLRSFCCRWSPEKGSWSPSSQLWPLNVILPSPKHPQVYVYHIFLSKKWKNPPKTLFQHEFVHVGCPPNGKWKFPFKDFFATAKSATRTCKLIGTLGVYVLLVARPTAKGWGYRRHQSEAKEPDQRLKPSLGIFRPIS